VQLNCFWTVACSRFAQNRLHTQQDSNCKQLRKRAVAAHTRHILPGFLRRSFPFAQKFQVGANQNMLVNGLQLAGAMPE